MAFDAPYPATSPASHHSSARGCKVRHPRSSCTDYGYPYRVTGNVSSVVSPVILSARKKRKRKRTTGTAVFAARFWAFPPFLGPVCLTLLLPQPLRSGPFSGPLAQCARPLVPHDRSPWNQPRGPDNGQARAVLSKCRKEAPLIDFFYAHPRTRPRQLNEPRVRTVQARKASSPPPPFDNFARIFRSSPPSCDYASTPPASSSCQMTACALAQWG